MAKGKEALTAAAVIMKKLNTKHKKKVVSPMIDGSTSDLVEVIPTGVDVLDNWVFGVGGLPVGRMVELYADEAAGKTSFGLAWLAAAQRAGGVAVLYETEDTLIPARAEIFGVDRKELILGEPDTIEDVLEQLKQLIALIPDGVGPNIIVWDTLAASASKAEIKGKPQPGDHARQMSMNLRVMSGMLRPKRVCLVIINQLRLKIGKLFGNPETTPGGNALKYFASIRMAMWKGKGTKEGPDVIGHRITVKAMKNKVGFPMRKVSVRLDYRYGFDDEWSTIDFAKERELIPEGLKMTPATHKRALEALSKMPGWYPNVFDPLAPTPKEKPDGDEEDSNVSAAGSTDGGSGETGATTGTDNTKDAEATGKKKEGKTRTTSKAEK